MALLTPESTNYVATIASIAEAAQQGYSDLPYHNWQHAVGVTGESRKISDYCAENGLVLDRFVTDAASLIHDYDYQKPLGASIRSRELRSSRAAGVILRAHGIDDQQIKHVQACIRSTEVGVACRSDEARAVRRADLMNVSGDYVGFVCNSWKLFQESRQLNGNNASLLAWLEGSRRVLHAYVDEDLRFDFEKNHGALYLFKRAAMRNLRRLATETEEGFLNKIGV